MPSMPNQEWDDNDRPLAYFITFRTHGTWLHGDERGSVERHGRNVYGTPRIGLDPVFSLKMDRNMSTRPLLLDSRQRAVVEGAIRNVCVVREYRLIAINVRTNHVHSVAWVTASPKFVMSAFKANATRELREAGLVDAGRKVWSRGGSTRYLWKSENLERAVHYTLHGQGDDLPDF